MQEGLHEADILLLLMEKTLNGEAATCEALKESSFIERRVLQNVAAAVENDVELRAGYIAMVHQKQGAPARCARL